MKQLTLLCVLLLFSGCGQQKIKDENNRLRAEIEEANEKIAKLEKERDEIRNLLKENIKQLKVARARVAPPLYVEKDQDQ